MPREGWFGLFSSGAKLRRRSYHGDSRSIKAKAAYPDVHSKDLDGNTSLMLALMRPKGYSIHKIRALMNGSSNVGIRNNEQFNALYYACLRGDPQAVKVIIANYCFQEHDYLQGVEQNSILTIVINSDLPSTTKYTIAQLLLGIDIPVGYLVSGEDTINNNMPFRDPSIDHVENPQKKIEISLKFENNYLPIEHADKDGYTALAHACRAGEFDIVELLREKGANLHTVAKNGDNLLMILAQSTSPSAISIATSLSVGDTAFDMESKINDKNNAGLTALMLAAQCGNVAMTRYLLNHVKELTNDEVNADGKTAVMLAAENGMSATLKLLLQFRARVDIKDTKDNNTALHYATHYKPSGRSSREYQKCCELLIQYGASTDAINKEGKTPLDVVTDRQRGLQSGKKKKANASEIAALQGLQRTLEDTGPLVADKREYIIPSWQKPMNSELRVPRDSVKRKPKDGSGGWGFGRLLSVVRSRPGSKSSSSGTDPVSRSGSKPGSKKGAGAAVPTLVEGVAAVIEAVDGSEISAAPTGSFTPRGKPTA